MSERNLIAEGFVQNTLTASGVVSGTQTVSIPQIEALVDEDLTTTAITITGSESIVLDADLGARWKLDRLEYYTNEASSVNINMQISDNNIDFFVVTMTGSSPLYIGDISSVVISGAPQYIRLEHTPSVNTTVAEWRAINDDSFLGFGSDGNATQVSIDDAPIGGISTTIATLPIVNNFTSIGTGFVFIDETDTDADDNFEVAVNQNGPFFGRRTANARQPNNTAWDLNFDSLENTNIRLVSSGSYSINFQDGDAKGWGGEGFSTVSVVGSNLRGTNSNTTIPAFKIDNNFGDTITNSPAASNGRGFAFRAEDYDRVRVNLKIPTLNSGDLVEGPRLFWRDHTVVDAYNAVRSTVSTTSGSNFTGSSQEFIFEVGNLPTWSGVVRSFKVQNYTSVSGLGVTSELENLEVFHSGEQDRLALDFRPVNSGTFTQGGSNTSGFNIYLNMRAIVEQPCIITSVKAKCRPGVNEDDYGFFLASIKPGAPFPSSGDNFTVKHFVTLKEQQQSGNSTMLVERPVFWNADVGDILGFAYVTNAGWGGAQNGIVTRNAGNPSDTFRATAFLDITDSQTNSDVETDLNALTWSAQSFVYNISYEAISAGQYLANGTYTTPVFDGGSDPALISVTYDSEETAEATIDVSGVQAFDTINARASNTPPRVDRELGQHTGINYRINSETAAANLANFSIGRFNPVIGPLVAQTGPDGDDQIENVAGAMFYNENEDNLWALNLIVSGTRPNNINPTWDILNPDTGTLIETRAVGGTINYAYNNSESGAANEDERIFEAVAFLPDYTKQEIYIIQRIDAFFKGSSTFFGIKLDLNGNYKNAIWERSAFLSGVPGVDESARETRLFVMRDIAYDGTYFYVLTDDQPGSDEGLIIDIYRFGNIDGSDPDELTYKQSFTIASIVGFEFATSSRPARTITYNPSDSLFYLYFDSPSELHTLTIVPDSSEVFTATKAGKVAAANFDIDTDKSEGFDALSAGNSNNWAGAGSAAELKHIVTTPFSQSRNSFMQLQTWLSDRSRDFQDVGIISKDFFFFHNHNHSFVSEAGSGLAPSIIVPQFPQPSDPLWGISAGTLTYNEVQKNGVLFPTGRYAQLQYTFNSNPGNTETPYLLESQLTQGVRVDGIPPNGGSKNIYLRTNLPENTQIGDQQGRLKVSLELQE